tara:strand:- start:2961 stop:3323 length:363 start_codon:yes stop_codon:yes gene_type:complete
MYSDLWVVNPGTPLPDVLKAARLDEQQAKELLADLVECSEFLLEQVSQEELLTLISEAGERSLNLSNLVRGEISTLMKVKEEINCERWNKVWTVTLPSGVLVFVEYEDYCVEIQEAKFNR